MLDFSAPRLGGGAVEGADYAGKDLAHLVLGAVVNDGSLWARFGVAYQPAWVFVNDDGHS